MSDLDPAHKELITKIIRAHLPNIEILAFGSRIKGTHKKYSDLDLALRQKEPIHLIQKSQIEEALAQSSIPYKIDLVDFMLLDDDFKNIILSHCENW